MGSSSLPPGRKPKVALIAGPTAGGKSALAMAMAERQNGVVINADSAQVYRDLRILSARPSEAEEARAPHRLYGYRDGGHPCSAADWAADAKAAICEAHRERRLPILVGGTGLYMRTLLEGIAPVPDIDPEIRRDVRALAVADAFAALERQDPSAAKRLRPSDTTRVARALEVVRSTGRPLLDWQREKAGGIEQEVHLLPLILLPPRDWLYERCNRRFETMFSPAAFQEVEALLARRLNPILPVMRAIGVRQVAAFLRGEIGREEAIVAGQTATRHYAKRQYTWFSRQPPAEWPRLTLAPEGAAIDQALSLLAP